MRQTPESAWPATPGLAQAVRILSSSLEAQERQAESRRRRSAAEALGTLTADLAGQGRVRITASRPQKAAFKALAEQTLGRDVLLDR